MTAKLAGAALIVAGAVWCCAARRRRQRQRLTLAQALAQALSAMETGIRWQRRPMPQLLAQLAQRPVCGTYFDAVREMLQSDMPLQSAWNRAFHGFRMRRRQRCCGAWNWAEMRRGC